MAVASREFYPTAGGGGGGGLTSPVGISDGGTGQTAAAAAFNALALGVLTANGDLLTRAAGAAARIAPGTDGYFLSMVSGAPAWVADGAAPNSASYLTLATNATLTSERVLTAGTGVTLTDAGAGSTLTVDAKISTGVSGGQTIIGGTGSAENLTIQATSHATPGDVLMTAAHARISGAGTRAAPALTVGNEQTGWYLKSAGVIALGEAGYGADAFVIDVTNGYTNGPRFRSLNSKNVGACQFAGVTRYDTGMNVDESTGEVSWSTNGTEAIRYLYSSSTRKVHFAGGTPVAVTATGGENVTNSVTDSGSTAGTIPDIADGVVYANDYVNLRRALFQLARMLKQDHDQLRALGLLT